MQARPEQPLSAAAERASVSGPDSTAAAAAAAVEKALQATGLEPEPVAAAGSRGEAAGDSALTQPSAERFTLPEGVDPLAAVLLRRRGEPPVATGGIADSGGPTQEPPSESTSEASDAAPGKAAAADADAAVTSAGFQTATEASDRPSEQAQTSTLNMPPPPGADTSHVQVRLLWHTHILTERVLCWNPYLPTCGNES